MQLSEQLRRRTPVEVGIMILVFTFLLAIIFSLLPEAPHDFPTNFCPQPEILPLKGNFANSSQFYTSEYRNESVNVLQGAIRIPTVSYDDFHIDPKQDSRFKIFHKLHKYLFETFPLSAPHAETVNDYGLLYTFKGSDPALRPVVLMAHQDVVPVLDETLDGWEYPPFEAHFDGEWIYGRGTADTKDSLIGILEAVESLLKQGWKPERTLLLSFGFDEEIGGTRGAKPLAGLIENRYGTDGVEVVIDEGFGLISLHGSIVGAVTVAEKGYVDIEATLFTPGGHSSAPPDHTGIGIMSQLVKALEANPFASELADINPTLSLYRCLAEYAPNMNKELRRTILDIDAAGHRARLVNHVSEVPELKYSIRTSQSVDVINGGVKINALPERVELKVNHRVNPNTGSSAVVERFEEFVTDIAEKYGLGLESHGGTLIEPTEHGFFNISVTQYLEPSPVSPHVGMPWDIISSTTRSIFQAQNFSEPLVVAPTLFSANTDTRHYWSLTRAIYRFKPVLGDDCQNYHTVNEKLRFRSHLMSVAWFYEFIIGATL